MGGRHHLVHDRELAGDHAKVRQFGAGEDIDSGAKLARPRPRSGPTHVLHGPYSRRNFARRERVVELDNLAPLCTGHGADEQRPVVEDVPYRGSPGPKHEEVSIHRSLLSMRYAVSRALCTGVGVPLNSPRSTRLATASRASRPAAYALITGKPHTRVR